MTRSFQRCPLSWCILISLINTFVFNTTFLSASDHLSEKSTLFTNSLDDSGLPYFNIKSEKRETEEPTVTLAAVGDIRITRLATVQNIHESMLNNDKANIISWLSTMDIVIGNLEMAFLHQPSTCTAYTGTGRPEWATLLSELKFSALNLANNHFQFDAGICGIETSLELLNKNSISPVGIGNNFVVITKNGVSIGMLGYGRYTMNNGEMPKPYRVGDFLVENVFEDIKRYKPLVDHLVISVHWGEALLEIPNPEEEKFAKNLFAAGVSLIIGSGPHVLQKIGIYDNGIVAYSLGNYIFDEFKTNPRANKLSKKSCILEVKFSKSAIESVRLFPILSNSGIVSIPTLKEVRIFEDHLKELSRYTESDYFERYELWKAISGRLKMAWKDARQNPLESFKKNLKPSYWWRAFLLLWRKYKYILLLIGGVAVACGFLFFKLRRRSAIHFNKSYISKDS
ncbi:MAG: CapA family protein [Planctomycetota bacterium]|jgi:poly-gamma-glutamate synthesis protein (capsule biosynthesis protein)